jgi:hypothetical protein
VAQAARQLLAGGVIVRDMTVPNVHGVLYQKQQQQQLSAPLDDV